MGQHEDREEGRSPLMERAKLENEHQIEVRSSVPLLPELKA